jgi:predicted NUDIX family NTP pyrophosphohydrolase
MGKQSAGIVAYRIRNEKVEVLLTHLGGPFWKHKDAGAWSIPKGEIEPGEDALACAKREFEEETGLKPTGNFVELQPVKLKSGKLVMAWAVEGDLDLRQFKSNSFTMEWPPRSGKMQEFPEVDGVAFFELGEAQIKINPGQVPLLKELAALRPSAGARKTP